MRPKERILKKQTVLSYWRGGSRTLKIEEEILQRNCKLGDSNLLGRAQKGNMEPNGDRAMRPTERTIKNKRWVSSNWNWYKVL